MFNAMRTRTLIFFRLRPVTLLHGRLRPFSTHAQTYRNVQHTQRPALWKTNLSLASATAVVGVSLGTVGTYAICDSDVTIESETGVAYEANASGGRVLAGTSARLMGGLVRVYAVGLYVSPTTTRKLFADETDKGAGELASDELFWKRFCASAEPMLRLVVVREVAGHHMCTGFERGLARAAGLRKPSAAAKKFAKLFRGLGTMKVGSVMEVECVDDTVRLIVDERFIGEVKDAELVRTICGMYLSEKAVTPNLRVDAASGIASILAGGKWN